VRERSPDHAECRLGRDGAGSDADGDWRAADGGGCEPEADAADLEPDADEVDNELDADWADGSALATTAAGADTGVGGGTCSRWTWITSESTSRPTPRFSAYRTAESTCRATSATGSPHATASHRSMSMPGPSLTRIPAGAKRIAAASRAAGLRCAKPVTPYDPSVAARTRSTIARLVTTDRPGGAPTDTRVSFLGDRGAAPTGRGRSAAERVL
jgi:hypothetical protein